MKRRLPRRHDLAPLMQFKKPEFDATKRRLDKALTMGTTAIEAVRAANPLGRNWFQLYMWKDRDRSMALVERAVAAAGFDTLLVTVDVPVAGAGR